MGCEPLLGGCPVNLFYTKDGRTWHKSGYPSGISEIVAIREIQGKLYAADIGPDVLVSKDSGATWNYAGLGLPNAYDVYADNSGAIRTLNQQFPVDQGTFARMNTAICFASRDQGDGALSAWPIYRSTDGGITFPQVLYPQRGVLGGFGLYADTCSQTVMDASEDFGIYKSLDSGNSWIRVFAGEDNLEGAAGVVYVKTGGTLFRTTDYGNHWTDLGISTDQYENTHFAVFGPFGEDVVVTHGDTVWMSTDGGDGLLSDPIMANDTITVFSKCPGTDINIPIRSSINGMSFYLSDSDGSQHEFTVTGLGAISLDSGSMHEVVATYVPLHTPGVSTLKISASGIWHCSQWSESRTIIVTSPPTAIAIAPKVLTGNCALVPDTGLIMIDSCQTLVITRVSVSNFPSERLQFQAALPDTVRSGYHNSLPFLFDPGDTSVNGTATIELAGYYLGTSIAFDTDLIISVVVFPSLPAFECLDSVEFGSVVICDGFADTTIIFTNIGCAPDTIISDSVIGSAFLASDVSLPIIVAPGDSATLIYRFLPATVGTFVGTVTLHVRSLGLGADTVVRLSGTGLPSQATLSLSDTALDLGTFSRCNAARDTTVTFTNAGCDSLSLTGASVTAGSGFLLLAGGDTVLAPGEFARYTIGFWDTTGGELISALHLHATGAHGGNTIDTTVPLRAMVVAGSRLAALNTQSINVGTTSICEERDSSITIKNTGCEPDTITAISFANATFSFVGPLPIIIPPHSDTTISIATAIDTTGHATTNTDTLEVAGNLDAPLLPVVLSRGIQYPDHFSLAISAPDSAPVRATVPVYVLRKGTVPAQATELDFSLIYNDDLLGYLQPVQPDISSIASTLLPSGLMERSFAMKPASDRDTIATIQFQSYLTRNDVTPITLTGQNFQVVGPTPAACIASLDTGAVGQNFTLELACGYGPMISTIKNVPFKITSIETGADLLNFRVSSSDPRYRSCQAQLLNILGMEVVAKAIRLTHVTSASFDIQSLPAGAYFLRLSAGGYEAMRPVMVLK